MKQLVKALSKRVFLMGASIAVMNIAAVFLLAIISESAFAKGGEVGNGGDVFFCKDKKSVLVDIYEAQAERGITLDLGPPRLALFSKIDMALKRLERLSPIRAKMYHDQAHNFFSEASLIPNAELTQIHDVYNWSTPEGCELKQIAVQRVPQFPQDKRYLVSKDLWQTLDDDSKAALILHEVVYREAIDLGFTDSVSVRYFNSLIFSHELDAATPQTFIQTLYSLPFQKYEVNGTEFNIGKVQGEDGGLLSTPFVFFANGQVASFQGAVWNDALGKKLDCSKDGCEVDFNSDGEVYSAQGVVMKVGQVNVQGLFSFGKNWSINWVNSPVVFKNSIGDTATYHLTVKDLGPSNFDQTGNLTFVDWRPEVAMTYLGYATFLNATIDFLQVPSARINLYPNGFISSIHSDTPVDFYMKSKWPTTSVAQYDQLWTTDLTASDNSVLQNVAMLAKEFFYTAGAVDPQTGKPFGIYFKEGTLLNFQMFGSPWYVESGTLSRDAVLKIDQTGNTKTFAAGTVVHFGNNGIVVSPLSP